MSVLINDSANMPDLVGRSQGNLSVGRALFVAAALSALLLRASWPLGCVAVLVPSSVLFECQ